LKNFKKNQVSIPILRNVNPIFITVKRFFLMGPPGSFRLENANYLKEQFTWKVIHTGEILRQQAEKKTPLGK